MDIKKSKHTLQVWQIAKVNLRHNFLPLLLLSVIIMMLTPVLFGITNLDSKAAAVPLECSFQSLVLSCSFRFFQPEQDDEVKDIVASKYIDSTYVYLIRAALFSYRNYTVSSGFFVIHVCVWL